MASASRGSVLPLRAPPRGRVPGCRWPGLPVVILRAAAAMPSQSAVPCGPAVNPEVPSRAAPGAWPRDRRPHFRQWGGRGWGSPAGSREPWAGGRSSVTGSPLPTELVESASPAWGVGTTFLAPSAGPAPSPVTRRGLGGWASAPRQVVPLAPDRRRRGGGTGVRVPVRDSHRAHVSRRLPTSSQARAAGVCAR